MEYQKLETRVATLNRALKDLTQVLHDWDSFTFVEVRTVCLLARLPACPPARLPARLKQQSSLHLRTLCNGR
jgi:hypothetical protein